MRDIDSKCHSIHGRCDGRIFIGILIVVAGVLAFLDNIDVIHDLNIWDYWPVILIVIGLGKFFRPFTGANQYIEGLIWIAIGSLFLLDNLDLFSFNIGKYWPLFIVLLGMIIILHSLSGTRWVKGTSDKDFINITNVLGGSNYNFDSKKLKGGKLTAFMGGSKIDLRAAEMEGDSIVIDSFLMMGGMDLYIPEHWRVVLQVTPILGGVEDKTKLEGEAKPVKSSKSKELIIKGILIMGGIDIKN